MRLFHPVSPRRAKLTRVLLVLLVLLGLPFGARALADYQSFREGRRLHDLGHEYADHGQRKQAISYFEQCVAVYPYFVDAWTELSELHVEQKEWDKAEYCLDQALRYCPQADLQMAVIHRERGSLYLRAGRSQDAEQALAEACRLDPTDGLSKRLHQEAVKRNGSSQAPVESRSL